MTGLVASSKGMESCPNIKPVLFIKGTSPNTYGPACVPAPSQHLRLFQQKLRDAGIEVSEGGKKGPGPQEENKTLKAEVKSLKEELEATRNGEDEEKNHTGFELSALIWPQRCSDPDQSASGTSSRAFISSVKQWMCSD